MRVVDFRSFRGRLVAVVVGLFVAVLAVCFLVVAAAARASARNEIKGELRLAGTLVVRQLESRGQQLVAAARLLSDDVALKTAAAAADQESTRSVLASRRSMERNPCATSTSGSSDWPRNWTARWRPSIASRRVC